MKTIFSCLFLFCLLPLFWACQKGDSSPSRALIDEASMLDILMEFHLAEAIAGKRGGLTVHREMLRKDLQGEVLERYQIDKETFYHSYRYYLEHPVVLDSIYSRIIEILEEKSKDEKDSSKYNPSKNEDSSNDQDSLPSMLKKRLPQTEE